MFLFVREIQVLVLFFILCFSMTGQEHVCFSEHHLETNDDLNKEYQKNISDLLSDKDNNRFNDNLGLITIPVVVHIVYNNNIQNISDEQVFTQIDVLNSAFDLEAPWITSIYPQAADLDIQFVLANVDPDGNTTNGITRTSTSVDIFDISPDQPLDFPENTYMKLDSEGGKDAWPTDSYLNIWVIHCSYLIKGFGSLPNTIADHLDGIVMNYKYFGNIETGTTYVNYAGGKSCVHEVGHWLDLRHIFANNDCDINDGLDDTPAQENFHFSCAVPITECGNMLMLENYMQYTYDQCQFVYTEDQKTVMRSNFLPGAFRESILNSAGFQNNNLSILHGTFWHDEDNDGNIDNNESRFSNINIELYDCDNQLIASVLTDNQGHYEFSDIEAGDYYILVDENSLPFGISPDPVWFEFFGCALINNGNTFLQDFPLLSDVTIGGLFWQEENFNGILDASESRLDNVLVGLFDEQFMLVASTLTNELGIYSFSGVYPGNYFLSLDPPTGLSIIPQPDITNYFHQSSGPNSTPFFNFSPGQSTTDINAAFSFGTVSLEELVLEGSVFQDHFLLEWQLQISDEVENIELQKKQNGAWISIYKSYLGLSDLYKDFSINSGVQYYRLKALTINGNEIISDVIALENEHQNNVIYFQNPVQDNLYINFNNQDFTQIELRVYNSNKCLIHKELDSNALDANGQFMIEMNHLPAGFYYLEYEIGTERIIKKMVKVD